MSDNSAYSVSEAVQRLDGLDASLEEIYLMDEQLSDADVSELVDELVDRLDRLDASLKEIYLVDEQLSDADVSELMDRLLAHPDIVMGVNLGYNELTDETGVKLARYVAASTTIEWLDLSRNQFGSATYSAMAQALRINTSLEMLYMFGNQTEQSSGIEAEFVEALRVNRNRPTGSDWWLFKTSSTDDFDRLEAAAAELGRPSM